MSLNLLRGVDCRNATREGKSNRKLADGAGLYLWVQPDGNKYWRLRYWLAGNEKSLALGVYPNVGLKEARKPRFRARPPGGLDPSPGQRLFPPVSAPRF